MRDFEELVQSVHYCAESQCEICPRGDKPCGFIECKNKLADDIANVIKELLSAVPQWISVEDELPDVAEKVLTYNGDFVSENWLCTVASKVGRVNVWAYSEGFVTHWMPLPAPPKEELNKNVE